MPFEKVHSLVYLMDLCEAEESGFASLREEMESLAPLPVEIRCPGDAPEIPLEEARKAPAGTGAVCEFVRDLLPRELQFSISMGDPE